MYKIILLPDIYHIYFQNSLFLIEIFINVWILLINLYSIKIFPLYYIVKIGTPYFDLMFINKFKKIKFSSSFVKIGDKLKFF